MTKNIQDSEELKCDCGTICSSKMDEHLYKKFGKCFVCANLKAFENIQEEMFLSTGILKMNPKYTESSSHCQYFLNETII
jgi:hypothetical protein